MGSPDRLPSKSLSPLQVLSSHNNKPSTRKYRAIIVILFHSFIGPTEHCTSRSRGEWRGLSPKSKNALNAIDFTDPGGLLSALFKKLCRFLVKLVTNILKNFLFIQDHFEINVSPLTIGITAHFYKKMMTFAFPEKDAEIIDEDFEIEKKQKKKIRKSKVNYNVFFKQKKYDQYKERN